jgi:hypothetical protein
VAAAEHPLVPGAQRLLVGVLAPGPDVHAVGGQGLEPVAHQAQRIQGERRQRTDVRDAAHGQCHLGVALEREGADAEVGSPAGGLDLGDGRGFVVERDHARDAQRAVEAGARDDVAALDGADAVDLPFGLDGSDRRDELEQAGQRQQAGAGQCGDRGPGDEGDRGQEAGRDQGAVNRLDRASPPGWCR